MKFEEYYNQMSSADIEKLNKAWSINGSDCGVRIKEYLRKYVIKFFFENGYLKKAIEGKPEYKDIFIGEGPREYLKYKILGYDLPYDSARKYLRDKYILFNDTIPDDFQEIILEYIKTELKSNQELMVMLNNQPVDVKPTPLLQLMLMINYIYKTKIDASKMFDIVDIEEGLINRKHFINYLQVRNLVAGNIKELNINNWSKWINNKDKSVMDFYRFMAVQLNAKEIFDFFNMIIKASENSEQWISANRLSRIFDKFAKEIEVGAEIGLIVRKKYNKETYVKLAPEAWYMVTGKIPEQWDKKEIFVTPLKEVFIPYDFNPFIIQAVDRLGEIKTDERKKPIKYCGDYFIISCITKSHEKNNKTELVEMIEYIKEHCEDIPDIVCNEILSVK